MLLVVLRLCTAPVLCWRDSAQRPRWLPCKSQRVKSLIPSFGSKVRDLWRHENLGAFDAGFTVKNLDPHATSFLIVTEV